MISKELLSEVLNLNMWKTDSLNISIDENKVYCNGIFLGDLGYQKSSVDINIYELSHKCKEYLLDEGYYIVIHPFKIQLFEKDTNSFMRDFHYPIQNKAIPYDIKRIVQVCQWILDNKDSK